MGQTQTRVWHDADAKAQLPKHPVPKHPENGLGSAHGLQQKPISLRTRAKVSAPLVSSHLTKYRTAGSI